MTDAELSHRLPHSCDSNYNLTPILAKNIRDSDYFKNLYELPTFHEVMTEITKKVTNCEPSIPGQAHIPSTAYCLLYKCFTLKLTTKQISSMLNSTKSPFIRALGFLYLRYVCESDKLWDWFESYLDDPEEFIPGLDQLKITVGKFARKLLEERNYYSTLLPRIPVLTEREIKKKLLNEEHVEERVTISSSDDMKSYLQVGMLVRAQYYQDAKYYDATIDQVLPNGKYLVTYTEYGNQEEVPLKSIKLKDDSKSKTKRSSLEDLDAEILRREREKATVSGKDYIKRSSGYANLSMKLGAATNRKRSRSRSPERREIYGREHQDQQRRSRSPSEKSSRQYSEQDIERKQKLYNRYGDASSSRRH